MICFSNSNASLDLIAPGCSTTSSAPGGGTAGLCGTSMATPHAASAAALLPDTDATLTPDGIEACLEGTGVPTTDAANGVTTPRVDALAALTCVDLDDGDGVPDISDNCPNWFNPGQSLPPWPIGSTDPDCDGFDTAVETFVGTLPLVQCTSTTGTNDEARPPGLPTPTTTGTPTSSTC